MTVVAGELSRKGDGVSGMSFAELVASSAWKRKGSTALDPRLDAWIAEQWKSCGLPVETVEELRYVRDHWMVFAQCVCSVTVELEARGGFRVWLTRESGRLPRRCGQRGCVPCPLGEGTEGVVNPVAYVCVRVGRFDAGATAESRLAVERVYFALLSARWPLQSLVACVEEGLARLDEVGRAGLLAEVGDLWVDVDALVNAEESNSEEHNWISPGLVARMGVQPRRTLPVQAAGAAVVSSSMMTELKFIWKQQDGTTYHETEAYLSPNNTGPHEVICHLLPLVSVEGPSQNEQATMQAAEDRRCQEQAGLEKRRQERAEFERRRQHAAQVGKDNSTDNRSCYI